jgi:hypothetical protein
MRLPSFDSMRALFTLVAAGALILGAPNGIQAQVLETSFVVGAGQHGEGADVRALNGAEAAVEWNERWLTAIHATRFTTSNRVGITTYYLGSLQDLRPVRLLTRHDQRLTISVLTLHHYRSKHPIRPFIGGGIAVIRDTERITCQIEGCEQLLPGVSFGRQTASIVDLFFTGGVSAFVGRHIVLRGGVQIGCPYCEGNSVFDWFGSVGYRFHLR